MTGSDVHGSDHFPGSILSHVEIVAAKAFGRRLSSKAGIRIGRVAVHVSLVRLLVLVLVLEPKKINPDRDLGAVEDVEVVRDESLVARLRHDPVEQSQKPDRAQPSPESTERRVIQGGARRPPSPETIYRGGCT
jgi:hypothetical protein